jgi:hypothetical protein
MPRGRPYGQVGMGYGRRRRFKRKTRRFVRRRRSIKKKVRKAIGRRKRFFRRIKRRIPKKVWKHGKAIKSLQKKVNTQMGEYIYREIVTKKMGPEDNKLIWVESIMHTNSELNDTTSDLPFFDINDPTKDKIVKLNTNNRSQYVTFKRITMSVTVMNNYRIPCHMDVYLCSIKSDTSHSPKDLITQDVTDIGNAGFDTAVPPNPIPITNTNLLVYPHDCPTLLQCWHVKKIASYWHQPGQIKTFSAASFDVKYNYASKTHQGINYQRMHKNKVILFRMHGPPSHGNAAPEVQGLCTAAHDVMTQTMFHIEYPSTMNAKRYELDDSLNAFNGVCEVASKPGVALETFKTIT